MIGQLLTGRYLILEKLGAGGFSETYLARDKYLPQHPLCVVKRLRLPSDSKISLETARHLFETEAQLLGQLGQNYPQIPTLFAYAQEQDSTYLVQEYIEGETLSTWSNQSVTAKRAIELLTNVLSILDYVHSHHVIHCDVTPSNLICRRQDSKIVLIDFGAACSEATKNSSANPALLIGTPGYIPDEQCLGMPQVNSDLYALGILVIHLLSRTDPRQFNQDLITGELDWKHYFKLASIPPNLVLILDRMVRSRASDRYQHVSEVLADLEQLQTRERSHSPNWSRLQRTIFPISTMLFAGTLVMQFPRLQQSYDQSFKPTIEQLEQQFLPTSDNHLTMLRELSVKPRIERLLITPHKRVMVSVGTDHLLRLWSLPEGKPLATLASGKTPITTLAVSSDSKFLVSGRGDGTLQLWDINRGRLVQQFKGHQKSVLAIAISPDLKILTSSSKDNTMRQWDLQTGALLRTLKTPTSAITAIAYPPTSDRLITASRDRQLQVWNLRNGQIERTFSGHTDEIVGLEIVNDHTLVSFGKDRGLMWDLKRETIAQVLPEASANSIMVSKCKRNIMTVHSDGSIRAWIPKEGKLVMQETGKLDNPRNIAFSPNHDYLISWNVNQPLRFWQIHDREIQ
ncbi:protein kinase domain-containing protein [Leptolyngbya sp. AN03gr2]|uniref:protein kinase domain-containing protein n=1 Tax=unclassified Leptolyngbya TaxID=2650499 RepID=UPI003D315E82